MSVSLLHSLHCHTCWYLGLSALEFGNAGKVAMLFLDQNYEAVSLQTNAAVLHNSIARKQRLVCSHFVCMFVRVSVLKQIFYEQ